MAFYPEPDIYDDGTYKKLVPQQQRTNALLVRNKLGEVKPTTFSLPHPSFTYGYTDARDEEGAGEVVNSWLSHENVPRDIPGRDFVTLNKYASMNACVTAKNVASFRKTNDVRLGAKPAPITHLTSSFPDPSTVFGRPSPQSAPISHLLNNSYQRRWIDENRQLERRTHSSSRKRLVSQPTKASLGHTKIAAAPPKMPFKLQQFANVPSRISMGEYRAADYSATYHSERARGVRTPQQHQQQQQQQHHQQQQDLHMDYSRSRGSSRRGGRQEVY